LLLLVLFLVLCTEQALRNVVDADKRLADPCLVVTDRVVLNVVFVMLVELEYLLGLLLCVVVVLPDLFVVNVLNDLGQALGKGVVLALLAKERDVPGLVVGWVLVEEVEDAFQVVADEHLVGELLAEELLQFGLRDEGVEVLLLVSDAAVAPAGDVVAGLHQQVADQFLVAVHAAEAYDFFASVCVGGDCIDCNQIG